MSNSWPWAVGMLIFNAGVAWGILKAILPRVDKMENILSAATKALEGINAQTELRHEENLRRLDRLERWADKHLPANGE